MKKSRIIIPCVCAGILLCAAAVVIVPRLQMQHFWQQYLEPMMPDCAQGGNFTEYTVADDSYVPVVMPGYTVSIPADCRLSDDGEELFLEEVDIYISEDARTIVELPKEAIAPPVTFENIDLAAHFETSLPFQGNTEKGLRALGLETPLSDYEVHRASVMLDAEDYPFWDLNAATAFCKLALYKGMDASSCDEAWVYETNALKGIVYYTGGTYTDSGAPAHSMFFLFYAQDDLNTPYEFSVIAPTKEEALSVINSVTIR